MRQFTAFLLSAIIHVSIFFGLYFAIKTNVLHDTKETGTSVYQLGTLMNNSTMQKAQQAAAASPTPTKAQPEPVSEPEPVTEPEPVIEPEPVVAEVEPKPVIKAKPIEKPKKPKPKKKKIKKPIKKKIKKKKSKKPKKVVKKMTKKTTNNNKKTSKNTNATLTTSSKATQGLAQKNNGQAQTQAKNAGGNGGKKAKSRHSGGTANAYKVGLQRAIRRIAMRRYPKKAKRMRKQGTVTVKFHLASNGKISNVRIANSSGHPVLDKAAVSAVTRLGKYKPRPNDVSPSITIPIRYNLR